MGEGSKRRSRAVVSKVESAREEGGGRAIFCGVVRTRSGKRKWAWGAGDKLKIKTRVGGVAGAGGRRGAM